MLVLITNRKSHTGFQYSILVLKLILSRCSHRFEVITQYDHISLSTGLPRFNVLVLGNLCEYCNKSSPP